MTPIKHIKKITKKHNADYGRNDIYNFYVKKFPEKERVTRVLYRKVLNDFNKSIVDLILNDAHEYILPCNLGTLKIVKYKPKYKFDDTGKMVRGLLSPNWKATKELWESNPVAKESKKIVYHTNNHSEGYLYKWVYDNYRNMLANKSAYTFIPARVNKKKLAMLVTNENFVGDFYSPISSAFKKKRVNVV